MLPTTRRPLIAFVALLGLALGQAAAGLHALKHLGSRTDGAGTPTQHFQLCLECASHAPLAGAHGSPAHTLVVAFVSAGLDFPVVVAAAVLARQFTPLQARAPPG